MTFERALQCGDTRAACTSPGGGPPRPGCAPPPRPAGPRLAFTRAFDEELYTWGSTSFAEYGLEAWSEPGAEPPARAPGRLRLRRAIARRAAPPPGLHPPRLPEPQPHGDRRRAGVIDFRTRCRGRGSTTWSAASAAATSKLEPRVRGGDDRPLAPGLQQALRRSRSIAASSSRFFHLLTVQRKLKDAARFEFISPGETESRASCRRSSLAALRPSGDGAASPGTRTSSALRDVAAATFPSCADGVAGPSSWPPGWAPGPSADRALAQAGVPSRRRRCVRTFTVLQRAGVDRCS